jgi:hypothetical protein
MSRNLGALTLLDTSGPAWLVMAVLYLYLYLVKTLTQSVTHFDHYGVETCRRLLTKRKKEIKPSFVKRLLMFFRLSQIQEKEKYENLSKAAAASKVRDFDCNYCLELKKISQRVKIFFSIQNSSRIYFTT